MAQVISGNQVRLDNGSVVTANTGGWYDGQQFWNGSLSQPGQIHPQSNQQGAGGLVSNEVIAQTNPANVDYIAKRRAELSLSPSPATGVPQGQSYQPSTYGTPTPSGSGAGIDFSGITPQASINLPSIYQSLFESSGINEKEAQLNNLEKQYLEQRGKISDNPFADASMIDQRLQRLERKFQSETLPLKNEIATKKADIETQINLQTKQFDINSQQAKQSLDYFNTLLSAGALDNASGEDIANLTRATGLSSSMIQSAVNANKAKNVTTSTISYDDGTNQGFVVINDKTGEIINRQVVSASKPRQTTQSERQQSDEQLIRRDLEEEARRGATWDSLYRLGLGFIDPRDVYNIYQAYGIYNPSETDRENDLARYGID